MEAKKTRRPKKGGRYYDPLDPSIIEAIQFEMLYRGIAQFADAPFTIDELKADQSKGPIAQLLCTINDQTGMPFPGFENIIFTKRLCDQFLRGSVDLDLLGLVKKQAERDIDTIEPYFKAFLDRDAGEEFGMPWAIMVFSYPMSVANFIARRVDEDGLVTGMSVAQRDHLKHCIFGKKGTENQREKSTFTPILH